jgi:hypothetical protein
MSHVIMQGQVLPSTKVRLTSDWRGSWMLERGMNNAHGAGCDDWRNIARSLIGRYRFISEN